MKLAALFSGGKDSIYSIYKAKKNGHQIKCLITLCPKSSESLLLHHPNIRITKLQSISMNILHTYNILKSDDINFEIESLRRVISKAKKDLEIDGVVHGSISSNFQIDKFSKICADLNISLYTPLNNINQKNYLYDILLSKFRFIIISVSSDGLDGRWLGKEITLDDLDMLNKLSNKYKFNINFDGGEAETLVLDCPLFSYPIKINNAKKKWDGYRGIFDIEEAKLDYGAR